MKHLQSFFPCMSFLFLDFLQVALPISQLQTVTFHVMRTIVLVTCTVHGNKCRPPRYPQTTVYIGGQYIASKPFAQYLIFKISIIHKIKLFVKNRWKSCRNMFFPTCFVLSSSEKITRTNFNGLIPRDHFSHPAELFVWVQAKYKHGCAKSDGVTFNTTDISKLDTS